MRLDSGETIALIRHRGLPDTGTELYVAAEDWAQRDVVETVLEALELGLQEVIWRRPWPMWGWGCGPPPSSPGG